MPELTDAQKVNREVTQKRIATALETLAQNSEAPIGLGMTGATVGQVPVVKTVDANGVPTSYEPGAGGGGQEIEVSDTEPTNPSVDVWFQEQQQGTPVMVYDTDEIDGMVEQTEKNLAYINTTSTAETTYHAGDYLVYNGQLYKVTASTISQGQTLTLGGNISVVDGGGFNDVRLKKLTVTGTTTSTGSLWLPSPLGNDPSRVVSAHLVGTVGVVLPRGDGYVIVYYYNMTVMADTAVTVEVYYV